MLYTLNIIKQSHVPVIIVEGGGSYDCCLRLLWGKVRYLELRWSWQLLTSVEDGWPPSRRCWTSWLTSRILPIRLFISWSKLSNLQMWNNRWLKKNSAAYKSEAQSHCPLWFSSPVRYHLYVVQFLRDLHLVQPLLLLINPQLAGVHLTEHAVDSQSIVKPLLSQHSHIHHLSVQLLHLHHTHLHLLQSGAGHARTVFTQEIMEKWPIFLLCPLPTSWSRYWRAKATMCLRNVTTCRRCLSIASLTPLCFFNRDWVEYSSCPKSSLETRR